MRNEHLSDEMLLRYLDGELPGRGAAESHLETCTECHERYERLCGVSLALADYSESLVERNPPTAQRTALQQAIRNGPRVAAPARKPIVMVLAIAADVLLLIGVAALLRKSPPVAPPQLASYGDFIALPYSDENLSQEGGVVVQVEVPRSALLLAGRPANGDDTGARVKAEVLVGADGLARAIRFLN